MKVQMFNVATLHYFNTSIKTNTFYFEIDLLKYFFQIEIINCPVNATGTCRFIMSHISFIGRWVKSTLRMIIDDEIDMKKRMALVVSLFVISRDLLLQFYGK